MIKNNTFLIKVVKTELKKNNLYNEYKLTFKNRQIRFVLTKLIILFDLEIQVKQISELESYLINKNNSKMFLLPLQELFAMQKNHPLKKIDAKNLANFLFYIYQTSRFYYDKKTGQKNIFINKNVEIVHRKNTEKRNYYHAFARQLEEIYPDYNFYLRQILKWVI
ncbi:hypothetical protein NV226_01410 [Mycoplasma iguanae]|uniref:Uncharacterized protein n=1 Tax=Mycoplasma iguanae TaxID=292461 RepID=A0ABY5R9H3_9MOLU|nr:hypothetical protein [Mycoplasma iguanae]UVD81946.1 hypothetical protein NV226_01410 [Mycoplasma iguanae]